MIDRSVAVAVAAAALLAGCASKPPAASTTTVVDPGPMQARPSGGRAPVPRVEPLYEMTAHWPRTTQALVEKLVERYGPPDRVSPERVIWLDNGPWKSTLVRHEPVADGLGVPAKEVLEQTIELRLDAGSKVSKARLAQLKARQKKFRRLVFPDRCVVTHADGILTARCDNEESNLIGVNLVHDVIVGKRSVASAQRQYERLVLDVIGGRRPPYAQRPQFAPQPATATAPPKDRAM